MGQLGKAKVPSSIGDLAGIARGLMRQTAKPRRKIIDQFQQALGGRQAQEQIPAVQRMVSMQRQALSGGLQQTAEQLAQKNVGGPFAQRILAGQRLQGEQQIAGTPVEMSQQYIQQMLPFISATQSLGTGALGTAGGLETQLNQFNAQQRLAMIGAIGKSLGGGLSGILGKG